MKIFWFLSLLACFTACACNDDAFFGTGFRSIGYRSRYYKELYELCPGDEFEYNDLKVNSLFRVQGYQEFKPAGVYALDPIDYHQLFNESDADQLEEIRSNYHQRIRQLYGQEYLNDPVYKEKLMYQKITVLQTNLTSFREKGKNPFVGQVIVDRADQKMEKARNFSLVLDTYKNDGPVPGESVLSYLVDALRNLKRVIGDENTTMAFSSDDMDDLFNKRIYKFDNFRPINDSRVFKSWKEHYGELSFHMHIPFEQHDSKWANKSLPCVPVKELPKFYQLKGKVNL